MSKKYDEDFEESVISLKGVVEWLKDLQQDIIEIKVSIKNLQRCGRQLRKALRKTGVEVKR